MLRCQRPQETSMTNIPESGDERRHARSPQKREASPERDPQRREPGHKRLHAEPPTGQPLPNAQDRDDEFPER